MTEIPRVMAPISILEEHNITSFSFVYFSSMLFIIFQYGHKKLFLYMIDHKLKKNLIMQ